MASFASTSTTSYNFLSEPADSLKCSLCSGLAVEPWCHDTNHCGAIFCRDCVIHCGNKFCPSCKMKEPEYHENHKHKGEINALRVGCENSNRGCKWEGTFGELSVHVASCDYTLVPCPKECKDSLLMRKDLDEHLEKHCPERDHSCSHCDMKGTFASITQVHVQVCEKNKVPCPNPKCEHAVVRQGVKRHLESCLYSEIPCKYQKLGCEVILMRKDMESHEEASDKLHLRLALDKLVSLQEEVASLCENQTQHLIKLMATEESVNIIAALHTDDCTLLKSGESFTFKVSGFKQKRLRNERFDSPSFYIAEKYRLKIAVYLNGHGKGRNEYISLFVHAEAGKYDSDLTWPLVGKCTFELLNQLDDFDHWYAEDMMSIYKSTGMGIEFFCPHAELNCNNVRYLKWDTLYFRVTVRSVFKNNMPQWLMCN